jgi:hypothetical protein
MYKLGLILISFNKCGNVYFSVIHLLSKCILCDFRYLIILIVHFLQIQINCCKNYDTTNVTLHRVIHCYSLLYLVKQCDSSKNFY